LSEKGKKYILKEKEGIIMISTVTTTTTTTTTTTAATSATAATAATTAVTSADILGYSLIAVVALIAFLALKEILSSEAHKNSKINTFINSSNVAILPLLFVFGAVVTYKVVTIL
jgi:hypothetical protein